MEHKASKLGTALAAAVLGLGLPTVASAQISPSDNPVERPMMPPPVVDDSTTAPDTVAPQSMALSDAMASLSDRAQALDTMGPISSDDVVAVSLNDLGISAEQRYTLMQGADPSSEATLQQALKDVQVEETGSLAGYQRSLADHLTMLGVDPASVMAVNIDNDGTVTLYYQ